MAVTEPVEERIVANVITTLQGITVANGYNTTVAAVRRQHSNALQLRTWPACIVVHESADKRSKRLGMAPVMLTLTIIMALSTKDTTWPTLLERFIGDVDDALRVDVTRGGDAVVTFSQESQIYDSDELGNTGVVAAQTIVEISYRTAYLDTQTSI